MATIYTILGTDSISSSRLHLNNNFDSINTELTGLSTYLNTAAQNLTLTGNVSAYDGTFSNNLNVTATSTLSGALNVSGAVSLAAGIQQGVSPTASVLPTTNGTFTYHTYLMTNSGQSLTLMDGLQGQEIMICNDGTVAAITITQSGSNIAGYTSFNWSTAYQHVTLRYINSFWYIIEKSAGVTLV